MEQIETPTSRKPRARKDGGQEQEIKLKPVKDRIDQLVSLHNTAQTATTEFGEAIKKAAEDSGLQASVVRRFVVARAGEKFEERKREVQQLEMLFDQIGE